MADPEFGKLLDAAEAFDNERARWMIRFNKMRDADFDFAWEVCRADDDGEPVVVIGTRGIATAEHERDEQAAAAGMRAALASLAGKETGAR